MRFQRLRSNMCWLAYGLFRFDRIEDSEPVSMLEGLALTNRSPSSFVLGFSLPCRRASSEYLLFQVPPHIYTFRWGRYLPRFRPLSRHHEEASTKREGSKGLTTFRPQAFSASRRFTPLQRFAGLFHPTTTSTVLPFRGFSLRAVRLPHRKSLPPCRSSQKR
jgi:hypothetical protein